MDNIAPDCNVESEDLIMADRKTREEFGEKLISEFANWATGTEDYPYREHCKKEAMEKFGLSEAEFNKLLGYTAMSWVF